MVFLTQHYLLLASVEVWTTRTWVRGTGEGLGLRSGRARIKEGNCKVDHLRIHYILGLLLCTPQVAFLGSAWTEVLSISSH